MSEPINDGGPAFPVASERTPTGEYQRGFNGMTLRDYLAGQAITGCIIHHWKISKRDEDASEMSYFNRDGETTVCAEMVAEDAYAIADAMIARRAER